MDAVYSEILTGEYNKKEIISCVQKLKQCIYIYICCAYSAIHSLLYASIEKHYGHNNKKSHFHEAYHEGT